MTGDIERHSFALDHLQINFRRRLFFLHRKPARLENCRRARRRSFRRAKRIRPKSFLNYRGVRREARFLSSQVPRRGRNICLQKRIGGRKSGAFRGRSGKRRRGFARPRSCIAWRASGIQCSQQTRAPTRPAAVSTAFKPSPSPCP